MLLEEYVIKFTPDELRTVAAGLHELPMKFAAPVVKTIQDQASAQERAVAEDAKAPIVGPDGQPATSKPELVK